MSPDQLGLKEPISKVDGGWGSGGGASHDIRMTSWRNNGLFQAGADLQNSRTRLEGLLESCQRYDFEHDPERKLSYWCQIYKDELLIGIMRYGIKDKI